MHGVIFTSFRDFVAATHGGDAASRVFEGEPIYLLSKAYDDARLQALIERAATVTGTEPDALVHDFGSFAAQNTFARLYPAFFSIAESARPFLLTIESRIHELVRATIPNARPPQLVVSGLGEDGVGIEYSSPRRLRAPPRPRARDGGPLWPVGRDRRGDVHAPRRRRVHVRDPAQPRVAARLSTRSSPTRRVSPSAS